MKRPVDSIVEEVENKLKSQGDGIANFEAGEQTDEFWSEVKAEMKKPYKNPNQNLKFSLSDLFESLFGGGLEIPDIKYKFAQKNYFNSSN